MNRRFTTSPAAAPTVLHHHRDRKVLEIAAIDFPRMTR